MNMNYNYYYNNVPGETPSRNNLIYTSLISEDKKIFVQWYYNDTEYHKGQNEVVDPKLMNDKFHRELHFLQNMAWHNPAMVPKIIEVNIPEKKIYLEIDGEDFWNRAKCSIENYDVVLPDWQEQMLAILQAHKNRGWYKYSLHPSSYFVVDGKLKSINYFFTYSSNEGPISIAAHSSHIYSARQAIMRKQVEAMGLDWDEPQSLDKLQQLCFESFRSNYPDYFKEQATSMND
jgi:hypothetical protein